MIDVPVVGEDAKRRVWCAPICEWLIENKVDAAYIERAQAFSDQGASSGFIYGRAVGYLEATVLCAGITLKTAEPSVWKRRFGLARGEKTDSEVKAASLAAARSFIGGVGDKLDLAKHEHRAEAMLIAAYGGMQRGIVADLLASEFA